MSINLFKSNGDFARDMLEDIMNNKFNQNENTLIRKKLFMDSESYNSLKDIDSEVIDDEIKIFNNNKDKLIQRNLFYYSSKQDLPYGELKKLYDGEIKFNEINKEIIDNISYSDSHASSCSGDTWHERLYKDYDYLSEISDIHSNLSDMSGDSYNEYLYNRYYKARDLIKEMRKEEIIYLFIESLGKYSKKEYEFIKEYNHKINQDIVKQYVNILILKKNN